MRKINRGDKDFPLCVTHSAFMIPLSESETVPVDLLLIPQTVSAVPADLLLIPLAVPAVPVDLLLIPLAVPAVPVDLLLIPLAVSAVPFPEVVGISAVSVPTPRC